MSESLGPRLSAARQAMGKTLAEAAAATRIRIRHLAALEGERWQDLPAPVYVRGYLRTYASYLDLDPVDVVAQYERQAGRPAKPLAVRPLSPLVAAPSMVLTAPAAIALGILVVAAAVTTYAYREVQSLRAPAPVPHAAATIIPSPSAAASAAPAPAPSPSPAARTVKLVVTAADTVWIDASVDGKPQFGDSGKVLQSGESVSFEGQKITLKSGKGVATLINLNGKDAGPLGGGVTSKNFSAG